MIISCYLMPKRVREGHLEKSKSMTTYTSLLWGDPQYGVEDWTATIRLKHASDLPKLNELREMIREEAASPTYRPRVMASYQNLLDDFRRSQASLSPRDSELIVKVLRVFQEEL
jgi:hypothetical protein